MVLGLTSAIPLLHDHHRYGCSLHDLARDSRKGQADCWQHALHNVRRGIADEDQIRALLARDAQDGRIANLDAVDMDNFS